MRYFARWRVNAKLIALGVHEYMLKPLCSGRVAQAVSSVLGQGGPQARMDRPAPVPALLRIPFQAFVCDDATARILRPIAVENGWAPERVVTGALPAAMQALAESPSPAILLVDSSDSDNPLDDVGLLAEVCQRGTVVVVTGQVIDVPVYEAFLELGVLDYLPKPFTPDQLRDVLHHAQLTISGPRVPEATEPKPHIAVAVIGARGGVGASTLAVSLAWQMDVQAGRSTALLDLDLYFGTGALALDLEPGRGLTDAVERPGQIDEGFLERAMVSATDRLSVLAAEAPLNQPLPSGGSAFTRLRQELGNAFEATVLDLPRGMLIDHPELILNVDVIIIVVQLTLAATRDTIRILRWLNANGPKARVLIVSNQPDLRPPELRRAQFEEAIERSIDLLVPLDHKAAVEAAKLGYPLARVARSTRLKRDLEKLVRLTLDGLDPGSGDTKSAEIDTSLPLTRIGTIRQFASAIGARLHALSWRRKRNGR
jgi:pilus assembly protein CpaE